MAYPMPTPPSVSRCLVVISDHDEALPPNILGWAGLVKHIGVIREGRAYRLTFRTYLKGQLIELSSQDVGYNSIALLEAILLMQIRQSTDTGYILYRHSQAIFPLCRTMLLSAGVPYGIWFDDDVDMTWHNQHMLAGASIRLCFSEETQKNFRSRHVFDCELFAPVDPLPRLTYVCARNIQHPDLAPTPDTTSPEAQIVERADRKVLLISYYMPPSETVAVHRLQYWEEMLPKIARDHGDAPIAVTALTAVHSHLTHGEYIFVRDDGGLNCEDGDTINLVDRLRAAGVNFFAVYWAEKIRRLFDAHPELRYDAVVMSGNPFFYFELADYFRQCWGATIITDFRDPFANNPRFKYTPEHKALAIELERKYISASDYVLAVNEYCLSSLELDRPDKGVVVANGFDERIVEVCDPIPVRDEDDKINFIYTGSFYADRNPEVFLAGLDAARHRLVHIGRVREEDRHLDNYPTMTRYGLMAYEDVVAYCKSMDVGVIFTSGAPFEQTTKIFDYIAADLTIFIITDGEPHTGELENLTGGLTNVFWARNTPKEIAALLDGFTVPERVPGEGRQFSRRSQTEILYGLIDGHAIHPN